MTRMKAFSESVTISQAQAVSYIFRLCALGQQFVEVSHLLFFLFWFFIGDVSSWLVTGLFKMNLQRIIIFTPWTTKPVLSVI